MTDAELTILSLVAEGQRFGSEIEHLVEARGLRQWLQIGFSSIYYLLNRLERQHLIASTLKPQGSGPARKAYEITEAGRGILQTAVADLLRQPRVPGAALELGLANLRALTPQQVYQTLLMRRDDLQGRLYTLEGHGAAAPGQQNVDPTHALYGYNLVMARAELEWVSTFLEDWLTRYPQSSQPAGSLLASDPDHSATSSGLPTVDSAKILQRLKRPSS